MTHFNQGKWISNGSPADNHTWAKHYVQGRPKASSTYSTEELEAMGIVGFYEPFWQFNLTDLIPKISQIIIKPKKKKKG